MASRPPVPGTVAAAAILSHVFGAGLIIIGIIGIAAPETFWRVMLELNPGALFAVWDAVEVEQWLDTIKTAITLTGTSMILLGVLSISAAASLQRGRGRGFLVTMMTLFIVANVVGLIEDRVPYPTPTASIVILIAHIAVIVLCAAPATGSYLAAMRAARTPTTVLPPR